MRHVPNAEPLLESNIDCVLNALNALTGQSCNTMNDTKIPHMSTAADESVPYLMHHLATWCIT